MSIIDFQVIPNSTDLSKLTLGVLTMNKDYCRTALHREGPPNILKVILTLPNFLRLKPQDSSLEISTFIHSRLKTFSLKPHHQVKVAFIHGVVLVHQKRLYY